MEIIELNADNLSDFEDIIDKDVSESIGREFYRGIVAVEEGNSPSGAMIWEYKNLEEDTDTGAEIVFIRSENGETINKLLSVFDEQASSEDVVRSYFETEGLHDEVKDGFSADGFKVTEGESRDLIVSVSDIKSIAGNKKIPPKTVGLSELMELQFMQGVTNCLFHGKKGMVEDLEYIEKDWFDENCSSATITDGKVSGLFLIHRFPSGDLMPMLLTAIGPDANRDLLNMIRFSAQRAVVKYPGDTKIILRRHNDLVRAITQKLFGNLSGRNVICGSRG